MAADPARLRQFREEGGCFELAPRTVIRVGGADRLRYLNGQMSNDLRKLKAGEAMDALVLTAKGKLCAVVSVWLEGDAIIVEADAAVEESLLPRLERYAISDDVSFDLVTPAPVGWHVFGTAAKDLAGTRIRRLGEAGIDVVEQPAQVAVASTDEIEILRIERGVPRWGRELNEDALPQEAGLEETAVDFHKGCYVGQEVVSRIESVGRVNRALRGFIGSFPPEAGELVSVTGEKAGRLTSAVLEPKSGKTIALGYLSTRVEGTSFSVMDESGACLGEAERSEFPLVS
ncbi:folate-binding protein YgfZ [soil metagenome]